MSAAATPATVQTHPAPILAALSLCRRDVVRFFRQRSRVVGAMLTPLVFWLVLGTGMESSFLTDADKTVDVSTLEYFFPGIVVLTIMFTSIYSTISIIEDRQEGFLQSVLVAPVPRASLVIGKILGGTAIALVQGAVLLILAPIIGMPTGIVSAVLAVLWLTLVSLTLTGLGFIFAWKMDSTQGFHAIMNLLLMPMWLLSGSIFPASGANPVVRWIMAVNPLSYGVAGLRHALYPADTARLLMEDMAMPAFWLCLLVTLVFGAFTILGSRRAVNRKLD